MNDTKALRKLLAEAALVEELQLKENGFWTLRPEGHNQLWGSVNHQPYDKSRASQFAALIVAAVNALPDLLDEIDRLRMELEKAAAHAIRAADFQQEVAATIDRDRERIAHLEAPQEALVEALERATSRTQPYSENTIAIIAAALAKVGK